MTAQQQIHEDFGCNSECRRSGCPEEGPVTHVFAERSRIRAWADRLYTEGIEAGKQHAAEWDRMFCFEREELVAAELKQILPTIKAGPVTLADVYRAYTEAPAIFLESFGAGFSEANS